MGSRNSDPWEWPRRGVYSTRPLWGPVGTPPPGPAAPTLTIQGINSLSVRVAFMGQLNQVIGCPDILVNTILGVAVRVFLDEISILTARWKKDSLMWVGSILSVEGLKRQAGLTICWVREFFLPDTLKPKHQLFQPWGRNPTAGPSGSRAFGLRLEPKPSALLGLPTQPADSPWDLGLACFWSRESQFCVINLSPMLSLLLVLFFWRTLTR